MMLSRGSLTFMRTRRGFVLFWAALFILSVALQYAAAMAPQSTLALSGAVYSSNSDGTIINANHYASKADVYLTGGPCQGGSHLDPGVYYFEVTDPSTSALLSTDAIGNRMFTVGANGFITSTSGTHHTHAVACDGVTGITVQLLPFNDTTNPGGEYKLTVATATSVEACAGFDATAVQSICGAADQKSDNFKVLGTGNLKIEKTIDGGPAGFDGTFHFDVDCDGTTWDTTLSVTTSGGHGSASINGITEGVQCTVTENTPGSPPANYAWGTPTITGSPATIGHGTTVTVSVTNHLVRETGSLKITKVVDGGTATGDFKFHVDCGDDFTGDATITLPGSGNVTIDDIPAGAQCAVTESSTPDAPAGFTWSGTTIVGSPATIHADSTADVTVTNTLAAIPPETGSLKVIKDIPGVPEGFTGSFDVAVTCGDADPINKTISFPDPGFVTIDGLPAGVECGVVETSRSDPPAGFQWSGALFAGTATIVADTTTDITVTNVLSEVAATPVLSIAKSNNASTPAHAGNNVTYTLAYGVSNGPVANGIVTDTLPAGVTYVAGSASSDSQFTFIDFNVTTPGALTWKATSVATSGTLTYHVTINTGAAALTQPLKNTACIDSDDTDIEVCATSNVTVTVPLIVTPPPTDVAGTTGDSSASGGSMLLILFGLVGLGLAMVFIAPTPVSIRNKRR